MSKADTSDGPTGPIIFSNPTAREYLLEHGEVYTFRPSDRTTGVTHWRPARNAEGEDDVRVTRQCEVEPGTGHLQIFAAESGFGSDTRWRAAIRDLHGELPERGYVYHVEVLE